MSAIMNRRQFLVATSAVGAALSAGRPPQAGATEPASRLTGPLKPALLGGEPVRANPFPSWPVFNEADEKGLVEVLQSKKWARSYGGAVAGRLEEAYAQLTGAKHCIAVANGTSALLASLGALDVGPGDEVILTPYTFVATLNVILLQHALPVFVDVDRETFQIDPHRIESAITDRTTAILPVHLGGNAADLDTILEVAARRKLPVVEDACQAHLAEWRGRKVGTWGATGCFSFQASKNLNCGERGAIVTNDEALAEKCYAFHNNCRPRRSAGYDFNYLGSRGANLRLTDFQAALLLSQMARVEEQSRQREENARYLAKMLLEIPGLRPARMYDGCTRNAYHLFMFRYEKIEFAGLARSQFLRALAAEGVPCSSGYTPLNQESFVRASLKTKAYQRIYPPELLSAWEERTACPENEKLCQEAVWFTQNMLIGARRDMDQIVEAIRKIQAYAGDVAKM